MQICKLVWNILIIYGLNWNEIKGINKNIISILIKIVHFYSRTLLCKWIETFTNTYCTVLEVEEIKVLTKILGYNILRILLLQNWA